MHLNSSTNSTTITLSDFITYAKTVPISERLQILKTSIKHMIEMVSQVGVLKFHAPKKKALQYGSKIHKILKLMKLSVFGINLNTIHYQKIMITVDCSEVMPIQHDLLIYFR